MCLRIERFVVSVVKVPKRHTVTHNTNGHGFAKLDCRDLLANAAVQSRLVGTDMHDRIQWVHRGVPLVPGLLNFQGEVLFIKE